MVFGYCIKQKEIGKLLGLLTLKCVNDIIEYIIAVISYRIYHNQRNCLVFVIYQNR